MVGDEFGEKTSKGGIEEGWERGESARPGATAGEVEKGVRHRRESSIGSTKRCTQAGKLSRGDRGGK